jgi:hypothetical protein
MGASLAASIPRTAVGLAGSIAGEQVADKVSGGNGIARVAGSLVGGAAGYGVAGRTRIVPQNKYPSVVRDGKVF